MRKAQFGVAVADRGSHSEQDRSLPANDALSAPLPAGRAYAGKRQEYRGALQWTWLVVGCALSFVCFSRAPIGVQIVSSRADSVSGGDVLVKVSGTDEVSWSVTLNGRDVTRSFKLSQRSGDLLAMLTGLDIGPNTLEIWVDGRPSSSLQIVDYPVAGPIFSGPHQQPFICQTIQAGLGPAVDSDCKAETKVEYYYKSTAVGESPTGQADAAAGDGVSTQLTPGFKRYDINGPRPADIAQTVTSDGRTVDYIVRREIGTINRAIYDIQFLHIPEKPLPSPWTRPTPDWNGRLVYVFGGGCGAGYHQGVLEPAGGPQQPLLAQGYAVVTSTLNIFANSCDDRVSAETLSMVKEHFIKNFGEPVHTIGYGASGGAMQVYLTAQNYPGLLDGIIASVSFPDVITTSVSAIDCMLLDHAFAKANQPWSDEQKTAVSGFAAWRTCMEGWTLRFADPRNCDTILPKGTIYDPVANRRGARCDIYDNEVSVFGRDPRTGFARRPLDNVGVQYGLAAFNKGKIDAEHFIEVNQLIGGIDIDGRATSARMEADLQSLHMAYRRGLVLTGGGGLGEIPIIDWRSYVDGLADVHDRVRSFSTRARLVAANGAADNQLMLVDPPIKSLFLTPHWSAAMVAKREGYLTREIDAWLDHVAADRAPGSLSEKLARGKPADLSEGCWMLDGEKVSEHASYDQQGKCNQAYPSHGDPRIAAGASVSDDVLKCALKPVNPFDYVHALNADQLARLRAIFPTGVCDYSKPGAGQEVTASTWQRFDDDVPQAGAARNTLDHKIPAQGF